MTAAVFFGTDLANPDTNTKFWCDLQMYQFTMGPPDPQRFMDRYTSRELATKANKWQGRNYTRWRNDEFDRLWEAAENELDPVKRVALFVRMNDMVVAGGYVHPLLFRPSASGVGNKLQAVLSGWGNCVPAAHRRLEASTCPAAQRFEVPTGWTVPRYILGSTRSRPRCSMDIAKLFLNGRSQAVRLPKAFRFEGMTEVHIQRDGDRIILSPTRKPSMQSLISALNDFDEFPARRQPRKTDRRESL